jgi:hypothetical protein
MEMHRHCRILLLRGLSLLPGLLSVSACQAREPYLSSSATARIFENPKESRMWMTVNTRRFSITLIDNDAARALAAQLPLIFRAVDFGTAIAWFAQRMAALRRRLVPQRVVFNSSKLWACIAHPARAYVVNVA